MQLPPLPPHPPLIPNPVGFYINALRDFTQAPDFAAMPPEVRNYVRRTGLALIAAEGLLRAALKHRDPQAFRCLARGARYGSAMHNAAECRNHLETLRSLCTDAQGLLT